jgi:uncharacterized membrane protein
MNAQSIKRIAFVAFAASTLIAVQLLIITLQGEAACLNEGCHVVESLTRISPFLFNLIGFLFFQAVGWCFLLAGTRRENLLALARLLLLVGLAVEGVLLSYQIFVVKVFCSYCLFILALVLLLNALAGGRQLLSGVMLLTGGVFMSALLNYGPAALLSRQQTIANGTYAIRTCSAPKKELYLFFSENCPHCQNVLQALEGCTSCNFHFNPVARLDGDMLKGEINKNEEYDPELNKLLLKLLGIDAIPVLLEKTGAGFSLIRGEKEIIAYVRQSCAVDAPLLYFKQSGAEGPASLPIFQQEGECSMAIECDEEAK